MLSPSLSANPFLSRLTSIVLLTILLTPIGIARAESYKWHPGTALRLGHGFDKDHPDREFFSCVSFDPVPASLSYPDSKKLDATPTTNTSFSLTLVSNANELHTALNIDSRLAARSAFASGSGSFSLDESSDFSAASVTLVLTGASDFGRVSAKELSLTKEAAGWINDPVLFARRCGKEVVVSQRLKAQISAVIRISGLTSEASTKIKASIAGSATFGALSGDMSASMSSTVRSAVTSDSLQVEIFAIGGEGISKLSAAMPSRTDTKYADCFPTDPLDDAKRAKKLACQQDAISGAVTGYLKTLTADQAAPLEFTTASFEAFGVNFRQKDVFWTALQDDTVQELYLEYLADRRLLRRINDYLRERAEKNEAKAINADALKTRQDDVEKHVNEVVQLAEKCLGDAKACKLGWRPPLDLAGVFASVACRHPSNGVERTIPALLFFSCGNPANCKVPDGLELPGRFRLLGAIGSILSPKRDANGRPSYAPGVGASFCPAIEGCHGGVDIEIYKKAVNPACDGWID